MAHSLAGVFPILHTPFTEADDIDHESLQKQIDWAVGIGADGVCTGMVSEIQRLTESERLELTSAIVRFVSGRAAVVASCGAESTRGAVRYAKSAEDAGCTALMAIPPVTCALPESELWDYFTAIAGSVRIPLIVQDASSYVGKAIPVSFYGRLLEVYSPEKILFKPEASPAGPNLSALRDATQGRAKCFDGSGGMLLIDAWRRGLTGTMPGCDLLDGIVQMWNALKAGDSDRALELSALVSGIVALQLQAGLDGFLAIEKYLMVRRGLFQSDRRRRPFSWRLDEETRMLVDDLFDRLMCSVGQTHHESA